MILGSAECVEDDVTERVDKELVNEGADGCLSIPSTDGLDLLRDGERVGGPYIGPWACGRGGGESSSPETCLPLDRSSRRERLSGVGVDDDSSLVDRRAW